MLHLDFLFSERNCSLISLSGVILVMLAAAFIGLKLIAVEAVVFKGMPAENRALQMQVQAFETRSNKSLGVVTGQLEAMRGLLIGHTKQLGVLEVLAETLDAPKKEKLNETELQIAERVVRALDNGGTDKDNTQNASEK